MLTERDAQEAEKAVRAIEAAFNEIDDLIDRAREKGWTHRVRVLRATYAKLSALADETERLFA